MNRSSKFTPRHREQSTAARSAFTLYEVLLALALTGVLIGAVFSSITLYYRLSSAGRAQIERAQLARSIIQRLESDIRSVVFREPESETTEDTGQAADEEGAGGSASGGAAGDGTSGSGGDQSTDESVTMSIEVVDPAQTYAGTSVGIFGDPDTLMLHVSRPSRNTNYTAIGDGAISGNRLSDLQSVAWFLSGSGTALGNVVAEQSASVGDPALTADPITPSGGFLSGATGTGLARMEGDRLMMEMADAQADLDSLAQSSRIIAPEVESLRFRYFDGLQWYDSWNSEELATLPRAIEVVFTLRAESLPAATTASSGVQNSALTQPVGHEYRTVIAVPMSAPLTGEVVP